MYRERFKEMQMDLGGAALVIAIAAAGYALYLHGPLNDALLRESVYRQNTEMQSEVAALENTHALRARELAEAQTRLTKAAAGLHPPKDIDELLSRLDNLARQCDFEIVRWQPMGVEHNPDYETHVFEVQGRGRFPALYRWFTLIENGVPLLDVTHLAIRSVQQNLTDQEAQTPCEVQCTLKLYTHWDLLTVELAAKTP